MHFREATPADVESIFQLYKRVSRIEGGIARLEDEVTIEYVSNFVEKSIRQGLIIVAQHPEDESQLVGEIHACRSDLRVFAHVFGDLTVVVDPEFQGRKIGTTMFRIFLSEVANNFKDVGKVELITRESNARAIALYQSLGFRIEGRLEMRIKTTKGSYEADIPMGWQNPNYEF
jgi:ribosomal protein S18 acetylase RimI-like enzyme